MNMQIEWAEETNVAKSLNLDDTKNSRTSMVQGSKKPKSSYEFLVTQTKKHFYKHTACLLQ